MDRTSAETNPPHDAEQPNSDSCPLDAPDPERSLVPASGEEEGENCAPFYIVGVGASAGGLEALETFFERMPDQTGMAFIVIQHLSPDFQSHMDELLGRKTNIPIHSVEDGVRVQPNAIYLMPPKKEMIISQGRLLLTDKDPERGLSMPIDSFLRSLAQDAGRCAIAVILSGSGSDGSRGVKHVHDADGLVIVQDEDTAKFDGMPLAAINTGVVDLILPPEAMPAALAKYAHETMPQESDTSGEPAAVPTSDQGMEKIFRLLRTNYGIDFNHYKPSTVIRRTERRSTLTHSSNVEDYARFVDENPHELNALYRDLLIGVTTFFRDGDSFARLSKSVVEPILSEVEPHQEIRGWIAGCATGEEAYSLAMLFHEQLEAAGRPINVKLFATDVHRESLNYASAGIYTENQLGDISAPRRNRYFERKGEEYHISPELRKMIVFAPHNVITDAPFTKLHLITCRNLLIYFQPVVQKKVLSLFHFGLKTGGYLFLGSSENPGELRDEFDALDKHWKIYRKRRDVRLPTSLRVQLTTPQHPAPRHREHMRPTIHAHEGSLFEYYNALLEKHMPVAILIDEKYQLLHTFGGAEKYLQVKGGRSPVNVLDMFDDELKTAATGGLQHAKKERTPVRYTGVHVRQGDQVEHLKLVIEPVQIGPDKPLAFVVSFERLNEPSTKSETTDARYNVKQMTREQIGALESELRFTKENLQATIEELETSNEELQATNEELVASNEELQSTNEELQSVNEELYTVNAEHQRKITELTEMTDDMSSLLESTDVGVIYLDEELRIRRFTPRMADNFNLLPQDVGRRIDTFAHTIEAPELLSDVRRVLETEEGVEKEVVGQKGVPYFLRILPYRTQHRTAGVVLTLIEISKLREAEDGRRQAEQELRKSESRKQAILDSALDAIVSMDEHGRILEFNTAAQRIFGYTLDEVQGQPMPEKIIPEHLRDKQSQTFKKFMETGETSVLDGRTFWTGMRKDGTEFPCELTVTKISTEGPPIFTGFIRDVSDRMDAEAALKQRELQFRGTFENAAVGMAHKDLEGRWLRVNDRLCEIVGYTREEMTDKTFRHITHPDDLEADIQQFERLVAGELDSYQMEKRYVHKNGSDVWVALTASMQKDEADRPLYCISIVQDISRRKQFEQDLQAAIEARESFLAMLSHELRNPLSAVINATRLLRRGQFGVTGFSRDDITSVIERQTQQMGRLLADLLDVSRIANGKIELDRKTVDLCQLVESIRETSDPIISEHDIALTVDHPQTPVWVEGDPTRLQQIQVNLLANAAKYSPPGSRVHFSIGSENGEAVIRVKDEGIGIPAHLMEKIFDPFVQSEESLHRSDGGLGVGLTLVSNLVKMHHGTVSVHSEGRGKGSEFTVRLPRLELSQAETTRSDSPGNSQKFQAQRIVLVEDQEDNAKLLKVLLEMDGHEVSVALDGDSGLDMVLAVKPAVAIMDIGIPKLNGYELAAKIREHEAMKDVFLIALTGYGQPSDISKAKTAGFDAHLVKPLDHTKLREILENQQQHQLE